MRRSLSLLLLCTTFWAVSAAQVPEVTLELSMRSRTVRRGAPIVYSARLINRGDSRCLLYPALEAGGNLNVELRDAAGKVVELKHLLAVFRPDPFGKADPDAEVREWFRLEPGHFLGTEALLTEFDERKAQEVPVRLKPGNYTLRATYSNHPVGWDEATATRLAKEGVVVGELRSGAVRFTVQP